MPYNLPFHCLIFKESYIIKKGFFLSSERNFTMATNKLSKFAMLPGGKGGGGQEVCVKQDSECDDLCSSLYI